MRSVNGDSVTPAAAYPAPTCFLTLELHGKGLPDEGLRFLVLKLTRHIRSPAPVWRKEGWGGESRGAVRAGRLVVERGIRLDASPVDEDELLHVVGRGSHPLTGH